MSKRKMLAIAILSGGYMMALGLNCIPNIGSTFSLGLNLFGFNV